MKGNNRQKAGKRQGNPGYRTASAWRGAVDHRQAPLPQRHLPKI